MAKSIFDELIGYRVKVERDGKEVVNVPGILALPGLLAAPKMSLIGMVAAPLLGCKIRVENEDGGEVDLGKKVQEAAETVVDTAKKTARTIEEEINRVWESVSADDPEDAPETDEAAEQENEPDQETAGETATETVEDIVEELEQHDADDVPTIDVKSDDSTQA